MTEEKPEKVYLQNRRKAYKRVFNTESIDAKMVLADLAKFCRASESTYATNERDHALLEGRREVWLRIQQHMQLSEDELWTFLTRKVI